jgi:RNA polymerase sigma factor (sigma-70 family)
LASGGEQKRRTGRSYRPVVEVLEALRLLSGAAEASTLPGLIAEHHALPQAPSGTAALPLDLPTVSSDTWDAALVQTQLADLLAGRGTTTATGPADTGDTAAEPADPAAMASGLSQLNKYLNRAWYRAAIAPQMHEDSTQAVYATLLQQLGRSRFDALISDVGTSGIKDVFTRETSEGLAFFRAVDMVKKRAQRERVFQPIDAFDVVSATPGAELQARREALREAIDRSLSPREASLIQQTLLGKTPAEIASHWGVAPKTVSNEKARVIQKLREVLLARHAD